MAKTTKLAVDDTIALKEEMDDGWWRVEINGQPGKLLILDAAITLKKQSSTGSDKGKKPKLPATRQKSRKDDEASSPRPASTDLSPTTPAERGSATGIGGVPTIHTTTIDGIGFNHVASAPSLISPRSSQRGLLSSVSTSSVPSNSTPNSAIASSSSSDNIAAPATTDNIDDKALKERSNFAKRASQFLKNGMDTALDATKNVAHGLARRKSKKNVNDTEDIPPPPPFPSDLLDLPEGEDGEKKKLKKRLKSSSSTGRRSVRHQLTREFAELATDLDLIKIEIDLIIKSYTEETGAKLTQQRLTIKDSPEERILEKMLESPYQSLFKLNNKSQASIALAPAKPLMYKEIIIPKFNINSIGEEERQSLSTREYDVFPFKEAKDEQHIFLLLMHMFHDLDLIRTFKIPEVNLYRFLTLIGRRYRDVPFHNLFHAFNVTQTCFYFIKSCQVWNLLGPLEIMALLIATICHDADHPGLNNDFQRKAQTRIAHLHKKSILENHHYLQCMAALSKAETNILCGLTQEQEDQIYIYLRDLILATDLAIHGIILKNLTERKKVIHRLWRAGNKDGITDEDRKLIMCAIVKCSDLSNEIRRQNVAQRWAKLVLEEFFAQSDKERELDLPVTPFMDKTKIIIAKEQINFIEKLCMPLYGQISQVFPPLEACCRQLEENRDNWQVRLRMFFSEDSEEFKRLSNKSIWERDQIKFKGSATLTNTLNMQATGTNVPKARKMSIAVGALNTSGGSFPPVGNTNAPPAAKK